MSYHLELSAIVPVGAVAWMYTSAVLADRSDTDVCRLLVAVLRDVMELLIEVIELFIELTLVSSPPILVTRLLPE